MVGLATKGKNGQTSSECIIHTVEVVAMCSVNGQPLPVNITNSTCARPLALITEVNSVNINTEKHVT